MRHYEIIVMMRAGQQQRGVALADRYKKIIADSGGAVHRFEDWGSRVMAYPVDKQLRAQYFLLNIECGGETLSELRENFRFNELVMRFLIVRRDRAVVAASPIFLAMENEAADDDKRREQQGEKTADDGIATGAGGNAQDDKDEK